MIKLSNLQKIVEQLTVLDIEDLSIDSGEIIGVVGPSNSGIQTLNEILQGKTKPSAGTVRISGLDPFADRGSLSRKAGFTFTDNGLYMNRSVEQNLLFFSRLFGLPKIRVLEVLQFIELADQADARVEQLPTGLARRLAFGRAILNQPENLILENLLYGCDEKTIELMAHWLRDIAGQGTAILMLNTDTTHLESICDRIYQMRQGRLEEIDFLQETAGKGLPFKIPIKLEGRVVLLNPSEILYAEATQGKTKLITHHTQYTAQFTLNELEDRLKRSGFFRAHRSFLVNLQYTQEVIPYSRNSYSLRLSDETQTEIPLSKNAAAELRDILGY